MIDQRHSTAILREPCGWVAVPFEQIDVGEWDRMIGTNLRAPFVMTQLVGPFMDANGGGAIFNISSGAAHRPLEGWSAYCAGKAGLAMLTRSISLEAAGKVRIAKRLHDFACGRFGLEFWSIPAYSGQ